MAADKFNYPLLHFLEKIKELMMRPDELATDMGTIIEGSQAVEYGIIDRVGGLSDALSELKEMIKTADSK